jgi:hypothetical protein
MTWLIIGLAVVVVIAVAEFFHRWSDPAKSPHRITPPAKRILFAFVGDKISKSAFDAALRIARAESATLVPAYIATIPLERKLDAPLTVECEVAMPLLEVIERRAARVGVPVDSRIETGRTARHALRRLVEHERFDRLVIPASESRSGFSADDIAWLLDHVDGEIVVLRPAGAEHLRRRPVPSLRPRSRGTRSSRGAIAAPPPTPS